MQARSVVLGALCALAVALAAVLGLAALVATQSRASCSAPSTLPAGASARALAEIPHWLMPLYVDAAERYGLGPQGWAYLASINDQETSFGRDLSTSSAGALGWMQFEPETWSRYGVAADPTAPGSPPDPYDPWDAIYAAASYLRAAGAPGDWAGAIYAYNHASWYVADVVARAASYLGGGPATGDSRQATASRLQAGAGAGCASEAASDTVAAKVEAAADELAAMAVPYVYGGGHVTPATPDPGLDCSSSVSWVLQHAGVEVSTMTSGEYESWGESGPGRYVTIFANPEHVFMAIRFSVAAPWRYFGTSGFGHPEAPNGTGPAWFTVAPAPTYLAGFVVRHPPGL